MILAVKEIGVCTVIGVRHDTKGQRGPNPSHPGIGGSAQVSPYPGRRAGHQYHGIGESVTSTGTGETGKVRDHSNQISQPDKEGEK